jgi:hypothetical protein
VEGRWICRSFVEEKGPWGMMECFEKIWLAEFGQLEAYYQLSTYNVECSQYTEKTIAFTASCTWRKGNFYSCVYTMEKCIMGPYPQKLHHSWNVPEGIILAIKMNVAAVYSTVRW